MKTPSIHGAAIAIAIASAALLIQSKATAQ
jgi:hypothetical protein